MSTPSLEGKYEVIAKIREGGMGAIYKVRHRLLNELRVVKVMRPEVAQSPDQRKRFLREAQTATRLRHPNIVAFYDFFVDEEDTAFMVMEYIEGINFRDAIRGSGAFPVPLAIDLSRQCLSAFEYLHRRGIVHRDVSPDNIMMTREEEGTLRAKLIDLGIAKIAQAKEELTAADEFIGKLRYSAPEQLTKSASSPQIDGRSDLFSLGIVIYEILTGVCPYGGESIHEIIANRLSEPPLSFDVSDPERRLPPDLKAAVLKALRTSPEERYQTAPEFARALEAFAGGGVSQESVERYVSGAMKRAAEASSGREGGAADLGPTVKEDLGATEASGIGPDARDRKFRSTIARWSAETPPSVVSSAGAGPVAQSRQKEVDRSATGLMLTDAEVPRGPRRETRPAEATGRGSPLTRYGAVALAAALLVGFGVWISGRDRGSGSTAPDPRPTAGALPSASAPSVRLPGAGERSLPGAPTAAAESPARIEREPTSRPVEPPPAADPLSRSAEKGAAKAPTPRRPTPVTRVAQLLPTKPPVRDETGLAGAAPAGSRRDDPAVATGPKMHYCPQLGDTNYKQGVTKDVPAGFEGSAMKAPRPDSGLMRIRVSVSKERPADDEPFAVTVRFENGGDARVDVQRLEESLSRGGMRPVAGAAVPVTVSAGGVKELYRYPLTLSGGEPYNKQFVVIDAKGDSWRTGVSIVPCGD